nr:uncharacterized protein LOC109172514 [Ipomoea batatas]
MDNSKRTFLLSIFIFWIFSTHTIFTCADEGQNEAKTSQESPSPQEVLYDTYALFTKASLQYWENVKSLFNQAQLSFKTKEDLSEGEKQIGATERLKDAAEKSFEQTKEAVEGSAKSAADAVHDAAEKVKDKMPAAASGKDAAADHGDKMPAPAIGDKMPAAAGKDVAADHGEL